MPYDPRKALELGLSAASQASVPPEEAVRIVRALLLSAALSGGEAEARVSIRAATPEEVKKAESGGTRICVVKGEVCIPFVACFCVCILPPGGCD
jgi:hypothetical protein